MVVERQSHGRTAVETALDGRAHRPRIEHIDRRVRAVVDAREHQIDPFVTQQAVESHLHAIDGRAGEGVNRQSLLLADAAQVERTIHGDGLAHAALRRLGRHDHHAPEGAGHLDGGLHAPRIVTVVVGHEYQSLFHSLFRSVPAKRTRGPESGANCSAPRNPGRKSPVKIAINPPTEAEFEAIVAPFGKFFLYLQPQQGVYRPLSLGGTADAGAAGDGRGTRGITGKGPVW